jgi:1,4-alpha-glucan branching enzyme
MDNSDKRPIGAILHENRVTFRVWAPFAREVWVSGSFNGWSRYSLKNENDGYWAADVSGGLAGQEYKFVIDTGQGELFRNDPRALQMTTAAGNSVIADPRFDWGDDKFSAPNFNDQVIYELHIGTFNRPDPAESGTFETAMEKLDYLAELGVNMIELMPISTMANDRGWGYATDYIYSIESLYGGRRQFLEFVKAAHKKGIGVIIDVVYNHFGPDGALDLWQFDGWNQDGHGGIYFYNDWRSETPWGATRPDFGRLEVRQYITDNVRMWMRDCRLDGLRVDSTIYIRNVKGRNNDPPNDLGDGWGLLQEITSIAKDINPRSITIAEDVSGNEYITKNTDEGGAGFSSQWEVGFPRVLRDALDVVEDANRNLTAICDALTRRYNNDVFQKVIYSDSHDSAANGASRLAEEISPGDAASIFARKRALLASAIILTAPGIPMIFQGQEFMQGGAFNDWQALDWTRSEKFNGIVEAHKHLIELRKNINGITKGLTGQNINILHLNEENKVLAYHRWENGGVNDDVIVIINFANREQKDYWLDFPRTGSWKVLFNSNWKGYSSDFEDIGNEEINVENDHGQVDIGPYSVLILSQISKV